MLRRFDLIQVMSSQRRKPLRCAGLGCAGLVRGWCVRGWGVRGGGPGARDVWGQGGKVRVGARMGAGASVRRPVGARCRVR